MLSFCPEQKRCRSTEKVVARDDDEVGESEARTGGFDLSEFICTTFVSEPFDPHRHAPVPYLWRWTCVHWQANSILYSLLIRIQYDRVRDQAGIDQ